MQRAREQEEADFEDFKAAAAERAAAQRAAAHAVQDCASIVLYRSACALYPFLCLSRYASVAVPYILGCTVTL